MIPRSLPTPTEFFWRNLGCHLVERTEGQSVEAMAASAFSRTYPHLHSDRDRLLGKLRDIQTGRSKETIKEWAAFCAGYNAGHALPGDPALSDVDREVMAELRLACEKCKKPKSSMQPVRLTTAMLMLVREDRPGLLVASIKPANPAGIEHHACGVRPYRDYIRDLLILPPDGLFIFHQFEKAFTAPQDLVLNLSARQIRTTQGAIDRAHVLAALPVVKGLPWKEIDGLARLADERDRDFTRIKVIDAAIDKAAQKLPGVDVFDLLDVLPQRGSASWDALRLLVDQDVMMEIEATE